MHSILCYHACMANQLTIRGVSEQVGRRLKTLGRERGKSVNALVLEILEAAVGVRERRRRLDRYATWSSDDQAGFAEALEAQRVIDEELWN